MLRTLEPVRARVAIRPLPCGAHRLQLHVQVSHSRLASAPFRATATVVLPSIHHARYQSLSGTGGHHGQAPPPPPPPPPRPSFGRLLLRVVGGSFRNLFSAFRGRNLKTLYRQNPEELVLALAILAAFIFIFAYVVRIYFTYFYSRQFTRYPAPVAKSLRRALYFSNYSPDPPRALKYYKLALEQCEELRMDPFSDDVMGIKIQLAAWLEQTQNFRGAIKILEVLLGDCRRWVEVMEKSARDGTLPKPAAPPPPAALPAAADRGGSANGQEQQATDVPVETMWGKRARLLGKAVGISVKLGELYSDEHVLEYDLAHERLTWSVETALKEQQRRNTEGTKDGEGKWMSPEEIGGALEALGHSYESRSQFHLAIPLFFQALNLCRDPCHSAVLMNNLAVSYAQHPVLAPGQALAGSTASAPAAAAAAGATVQPAELTVPQARDRSEYVESARRWAQNARRQAREPQGELRTPECDQACAVALCTLADVEALSGRPSEARRRYLECAELSKKIGFDAGVSQAQAGLRKLPK
ncbi:uncharacterized protein E0L32_000051 [Thyridium curvatum]|uniref:Uncharacterized protein n=1 Tax=Thyridium curvatum TaxID=1093900 RepID=A0A507B7F7_9PEZI|nr:uncharacterized protein E0L32_000051 [Thyridium curvatum]TPX15717.1 hypothetical protein E0L32_000051 [Thyridium curvatum]